MKISNGLQKLLEPLQKMIAIPESLLSAIRKAGKRGKGSYYPTDLRNCGEIILETIHDVSGEVFSVRVENGNFEEALKRLKNKVFDADYLMTLPDYEFPLAA